MVEPHAASTSIVVAPVVSMVSVPPPPPPDTLIAANGNGLNVSDGSKARVIGETTPLTYSHPVPVAPVVTHVTMASTSHQNTALAGTFELSKPDATFVPNAFTRILQSCAVEPCLPCPMTFKR